MQDQDRTQQDREQDQDPAPARGPDACGEEWLSVTAAAALLETDRRNVIRAVHRGDLVARKVQGKRGIELRLKRADVLAYRLLHGRPRTREQDPHQDPDREQDRARPDRDPEQDRAELHFLRELVRQAQDRERALHVELSQALAALRAAQEETQQVRAALHAARERAALPPPRPRRWWLLWTR